MADPELLFEAEGLYENLTAEEYEDFLNGEHQYNYFAILYMAIMPISCVIGLTGNCLVYILIRSNQIFRRLPSSPYLLALSICSTIFLVSLLSFWLEESFFKDPHEKHSTFTCKFSTFFAHFSDFTSVWLIVLVGYERLVLLYKATRFQRSLSNSRRQVIVLLIISLFCNFWILFVAESNEQGYCGVKDKFENIYNIFMLIEAALNMALPSILIVASNVLVILKLHAHLKRIPASSVTFNTNDTVYNMSGPTQTIKSSKISKASLYRLSSRLSMSKIDNAEVAALHKRHSLRYADLQLSRSLSIMTTFFIMLNLPNYIYRITILVRPNIQPEIMQSLSFLALTLLYLHHALLFFVYIFNSPQMRKRLLPTAGGSNNNNDWQNWSGFNKSSWGNSDGWQNWGRHNRTSWNNAGSYNGSWPDWPGFNKSSWGNLSWYLKKLPQKQFFGMRFILNVTGEACIPRWYRPKPGCWNPGWPWPWPGHGGGGSRTTTKKPSTGKTSTVKSSTGRTSTTRRTSTGKTSTVKTSTTKPTSTKTYTSSTGKTFTTTKVTETSTGKVIITTTTGKVTQSTGTSTTTVPTSTSTTTSTTTTTPPVPTTQTSPTVPSGDPETTTCMYSVDILDTHFCRQILQASQGAGTLADCQKYYSNETLMQFYNECVQFECKYQRAYQCYGTWKFVQNCTAYLQADESTFGWRYLNACPVNSTPFPAITFTDLTTTGAATQAVGKRSINDDDQEDDDNAIDEGTESVAFGIKNNWCVPRIYAWWWRRHGGKLPGRDSDEDWSNGWSNEDESSGNNGDHSWGNSWEDGNSGDKSNDKSHNSPGKPSKNNGKGHGKSNGGKSNNGKGHGKKNNKNNDDNNHRG